ASISVIDIEILLKNGLCSKNDKVKVLSRGELKSKVEVNVHAFSKAAIAAIEKTGGKATIL
ncbi:MAG TPA: uL15m family ribosomal protein, partial [Cytophagaceae bacterium]|nr:uL15m family ribosomal protein [Cytophagaceae bacterium]